MIKKILFEQITRRHALTLLAVAITSSAFPARSFADASTVDKKILGLTGGKEVGTGLIELDLPEIAENGNAVKIAFSIDSPMTSKNYIKTVYIMADGNPSPEGASFNFSPRMGACSASTRMRLAKTQNIVVLAEANDGSFQHAQQKIKVTIGGCGG